MIITDDAAIDLMSANYTVVGLVLIYHLFALQHWLTRVEDSSDHAISEYSSKAQNSIEIAYLRDRCAHHRQNFPLADVLILGALICVLAGLSYVASCYARTKAPQFLTLAPVVVMFVAYFAGSILAWRRGERKIQEVLRVLPEVTVVAADGRT